MRSSNYKKNKYLKKRGVTLLEILIYIALLSGLMIIVSDSFTSLAKGRGQSVARAEVNASIRFAEERIAQDVKSATSIDTPILGALSPVLIMTINGTPVTYDTSGGVLRRTEGVNPPVFVTGTNVYVNPSTFTKLENFNPSFNATTTSLSIGLSVSYNASSSDWSYTSAYQTAVNLR